MGGVRAVGGLSAPGGLEQATRVAEHAAGGAVVAAAVLRSLGADVEFFCALGDDERARRSEHELTARGITVHAAHRSQPSRFVFTMLDAGGERTIVTVGERLQPAGDDELDWGRLTTIDGVYFTAGDGGALAAARAARTLVVTPRAGDHETGLSAAPHVDATVFSAHDRDEVRWAARLGATQPAAGRDRRRPRWALVGRELRPVAGGAGAGADQRQLWVRRFVRRGADIRAGERPIGRGGGGDRRAQCGGAMLRAPGVGCPGVETRYATNPMRIRTPSATRRAGSGTPAQGCGVRGA